MIDPILAIEACEVPTRKYKTPAAARAARREKMGDYRKDSYARAAYVTPPVRLDPIQAQALQKIMDAVNIGPGDAVRLALMETAAKIGVRSKPE